MDGYYHKGLPGLPASKFSYRPQGIHMIFYYSVTVINRNSLACPVLDVTYPGDPNPKLIAPGADVRTDAPTKKIS